METACRAVRRVGGRQRLLKRQRRPRRRRHSGMRWCWRGLACLGSASSGRWPHRPIWHTHVGVGGLWRRPRWRTAVSAADARAACAWRQQRPPSGRRRCSGVRYLWPPRLALARRVLEPAAHVRAARLRRFRGSATGNARHRERSRAPRTLGAAATADFVCRQAQPPKQ